MELRPQLLLEGLAVAMRFCETDEAYIYLREEYATLAGGARGRDRGPRAPGRARDRRRRVHLRRGDGDARVDGGAARDAAAAAAVPGAVRLPRPADADQQRRDARARRADPRAASWRAGRGSGRSPARSRSPAATRRRSTSRSASWSTSTPAALTAETGAIVPGGAASGILPPAALDVAADARGARASGAAASARPPSRSSRAATPASACSPRRCASSPRSRARSARRAGSATARSTTSSSELERRRGG